MIIEVDKNLHLLVQTISLLVAIPGGLFAVFKAIYEIKETRLQRDRELRWKQAEAAKKLSDEMLADPNVLSALLMLDWDDREIEMDRGKIERFTRRDWTSALRTTNTKFSDKEAYIRDCFDNLFYFLGVIQHHISRNLVLHEDVVYPIEYYVSRMTRERPAFVNYMREYGYSRTLQFLDRFPAWKSQVAISTTPDRST